MGRIRRIALRSLLATTGVLVGGAVGIGWSLHTGNPYTFAPSLRVLCYGAQLAPGSPKVMRRGRGGEHGGENMEERTRRRESMREAHRQPYTFAPSLRVLCYGAQLAPGSPKVMRRGWEEGVEESMEERAWKRGHGSEGMEARAWKREHGSESMEERGTPAILTRLLPLCVCFIISKI
jgi:hypothetical protein